LKICSEFVGEFITGFIGEFIIGFVGDLFRICWRFVGDLLEICWRIVGDLLEICSVVSHSVIHYRMLLDFTIEYNYIIK
jgi:hypothetical protein